VAVTDVYTCCQRICGIIGTWSCEAITMAEIPPEIVNHISGRKLTTVLPVKYSANTHFVADFTTIVPGVVNSQSVARRPVTSSGGRQPVL